MPYRSLERRALRLMLSLPPPILRAVAGGGVVHRAGRTLDPRLQFLGAMREKKAPGDGLDPLEARRDYAAGARWLGADLSRGVTVEAETIEGPRGPIPARVYRPANRDRDAPVMVYAPCEGGVIADLDAAEAFCGLLAESLKGVVLSVAPRTAPEHRFPAGLEDVLAAFRHARDHAGDYGAPPGRAAIGGESVGAAFAAATTQILKSAGEAQPAFQLLLYPCLDMANPAAAATRPDVYPFARPPLSWFIGHYMGPEADPADPTLSPLRAPSLAGLAPAIVAAAGFDPLRDQGKDYALRLRDAGVAVTYRAYDSLPHGFTAMAGASRDAQAACREIAGLARQALVADAVDRAMAAP